MSIASKKWSARKEKEGLCKRCGRRPHAANRLHCGKCCKQTSHKKTKRDEWREQGLCQRCGRKRYLKYSECKRCHFLETNRIKKRRMNGICERCSGMVIPSTFLCETHHFMAVSHRLWKTRNRWADLKTLFAAQGGKCVYSGLALTIGVDASIDHRIPKATGGSDDISNLQWVHFMANTMKWNAEESKFLELVGTIAKHRNLV